MSTIRTYPMSSSAILRLNFIKDRILKNPVYQRNGDVWSLEKKQLLMDSILNDYDIPKLYFHDISGTNPTTTEKKYEYAIIDGRQRLESIWGFMNDEWSLANDFSYLADPDVKAGGLRYSDLAAAYPELKVFFDSFNLPIVVVKTDDLELIEDMFSRLNEAVPLNAAEKRNALGGAMATAIREMASTKFFTETVKLGNRRYQHQEVAARLLFIEYSLLKFGRIQDTKKPYIDQMVKNYRGSSELPIELIVDPVNHTLEILSTIFSTQDELLRTQAGIPIYYLCAQSAQDHGELNKITRARIIEFNTRLHENRTRAEMDLGLADYRLLEYERMSQQGTNDASSIRERAAIMCEFLGVEPNGKIRAA
jgi:Protein of unknown function DUF262